MYAAIHRYDLGEGSMDAIIRSVSANFADSAPAKAGAMLYTAIDTGDGTATTIVLFPDQATAERGQLASDEVRTVLNKEFGVTESERIEGPILLHRAFPAVVENVDL